MAASASPGTEVFFLPGRVGQLFSIYRSPTQSGQIRRGVLVVPPFAEEMNKARPMLTLLGTRLAQSGVSMLLTDLYGTGDSEGDFRDATWEIWLNDLRAALGWLQQRGPDRLTVLGMRTGALLADDLVHCCPGVFSSAILWQPVVSGRNALTQFLRLRLAANLTGKPDEKETTTELRARLAAGESLEVAGYELTAGLGDGMDSAQLSTRHWQALDRVYWCEVAAKARQGPMPATVKAVAELEQRGVSVEMICVAGEAFWATPEITTVPELVDATVSTLR